MGKNKWNEMKFIWKCWNGSQLSGAAHSTNQSFFSISFFENERMEERWLLNSIGGPFRNMKILIFNGGKVGERARSESKRKSKVFDLILIEQGASEARSEIHE